MELYIAPPTPLHPEVATEVGPHGDYEATTVEYSELQLQIMKTLLLLYY